MFLKKVLKFIYLYLFPNYLKLVLFSLLKKHFSLNDKIKKHLTFKGFFKLKYNGKSIYVYSLPTIIESDIFWNGIENSKHEPMCYKIFYYFAHITVYNKIKVFLQSSSYSTNYFKLGWKYLGPFITFPCSL